MSNKDDEKSKMFIFQTLNQIFIPLTTLKFYLTKKKYFKTKDKNFNLKYFCLCLSLNLAFFMFSGLFLIGYSNLKVKLSKISDDFKDLHFLMPFLRF